MVVLESRWSYWLRVNELELVASPQREAAPTPLPGQLRVKKKNRAGQGRGAAGPVDLADDVQVRAGKG